MFGSWKSNNFQNIKSEKGPQYFHDLKTKADDITLFMVSSTKDPESSQLKIALFQFDL